MEDKKTKARKVITPEDKTLKELQNITLLLTEIREMLENIWRDRTPE